MLAVKYNLNYAKAIETIIDPTNIIAKITVI